MKQWVLWLIAAGLVLVLAVFLYLVLIKKSVTEPESTTAPASPFVDRPVEEITPFVNVETNPFDADPSIKINPAETANPFQKTYQNPFE